MKVNVHDGVWCLETRRGSRCYSFEEAEAFVAANLRAPTLAGRVSPLLALQVAAYRDEGENPLAFARPMLDVIASIESVGKNAPKAVSWEKPHAPLKGAVLGPLKIWHKHVSLAVHMPFNAAMAIAPQTEKKASAIKDALQVSLEKALAETGGDLAATAEAGARTLMEYVKGRMKGRQTGDWLIFEIDDGKPYFLFFFPHASEADDDKAIAAMVDFVRKHWVRP